MAAALPTTITPEIELTRDSEFRILETEFGDGYRQRAGDGINTQNKTYTAVFTGENADIEALVTHFEERGGYQAFTWTPPGESTSQKWTCKNFSTSIISNSHKELIATIRREYDL